MSKGIVPETYTMPLLISFTFMAIKIFKSD